MSLETEEIVITATRYAKSLDSIPANVSVITAAQIKNAVARTIPELLRTQVGLHVTDLTGNRQTYNVDIRGFGEAGALNTLVLVDGRRINSADLSGTDWTVMPLDRVERIEIIRGARTSVIYGDNASGGVVNIITQQGDTFRAGGEFRGGSYNTYEGAAYLSGTAGDFTYALSGSVQRSDGYRENSDTDFDSFGANFRYDPLSFLHLELSGGYTENNAGLPGALKTSDFAAGYTRTDSVSPNDFADIDDYFIKGGPEIQLGENNRFNMEVSLRQRNSTAFATYVGGNFTGNTGLETITASPQFIIQEELFGLENSLTFGFDYISNDEDIFNQSYYFGDFSEGRFSLKKQNYGVFIEDQLVPLEGLTLSAGYRYDRAKFAFDSGPQASTSLDENAYTVGLTYRVDEHFDTYFSLSRGFRYPVLHELFNFFTNEIDPTLRPQWSRDYEVGIRSRYNDRVGFNINFFYIETHDEIFFDPATFANINLDGTTRRTGVELYVYGGLGILDLSVVYTYTDSEILDGPYQGSVVPGVPAQRVTLGGLLSLGWGFSLAADGVYVGPRPFISDFANAFFPGRLFRDERQVQVRARTRISLC